MPLTSKCTLPHSSLHVDVRPSSSDLPFENVSEDKVLKGSSNTLTSTTSTPMPLSLVSPLEKETDSQKCVQTSTMTSLVPGKCSTMSSVAGETSTLTDISSSFSPPSREKKVGQSNKETKKHSRSIPLQKTKPISTSSPCDTKKIFCSSCHPSRDSLLPSSAHTANSRTSRQAASSHPHLSSLAGKHSSSSLSSIQKGHPSTPRCRKAIPISLVETSKERPVPSTSVVCDVGARNSLEKSCSSLARRRNGAALLPIHPSTDKETPENDLSPTPSSPFSSEFLLENLFSPPPSLTLSEEEEEDRRASLRRTGGRETVKSARVGTTVRGILPGGAHGVNDSRCGGVAKGKHSSSSSLSTLGKKTDATKGKKKKRSGRPTSPRASWNTSRDPPLPFPKGALHKKKSTGAPFSWKAFAGAALESGISGILRRPIPSGSVRASTTSSPEMNAAKTDFRTVVSHLTERSAPSSVDGTTQDTCAPPLPPSPTHSVCSSSYSSFISLSCVVPQRRVCLDPSFVRKDILHSTLEVLRTALKTKYRVSEILPTTPRGVVHLVFPLFRTAKGTAAVAMAASLPTFSFPAGGPIRRSGAAPATSLPTSEGSTKRPPRPQWDDDSGKASDAPRWHVEVASVGPRPMVLPGPRDRMGSMVSLPTPAASTIFPVPFSRLPPSLLVKAVSLYEFHQALVYAMAREGNGAAERYRRLAPWLVSPIPTMMAYMGATTASPVGADELGTARTTVHPDRKWGRDDLVGWNGQEDAGFGRRKEDNARNSSCLLPHHNVGKVYDLLTRWESTLEACGSERVERTSTMNALTSTYLHYLEENQSNVFFRSDLEVRPCLPSFVWKGSTCLPRGSFFLYVRGDESGVSLAPRVGTFSKKCFRTRDATCDLSCVAPVESAVSSTSQGMAPHRRGSPAGREGPHQSEDAAVENPTFPTMASGFPPPSLSVRHPHLTPGGWALHPLANLLWQTLCGLRHLHTKNHLYHGNIKPSNFIFSADDGHLILTDIGLPFFPDAMVKAERHTISFSKWHRPSPFCPPIPSSRLTQASHATLDAAHSPISTPQALHDYGVRDGASDGGEGEEEKSGQERMAREGWWTYPPYLRIRNTLLTPPEESLPSCMSVPSSHLFREENLHATPKDPDFVQNFTSCASDTSSHSLSSTSLLIEEFHFLQHFMAPECMLEVEGSTWVDYTAQSPASDAYAVGMVFYWLYHGAFPPTSPLLPEAVRYDELPISLRERYPTPDGGGRNPSKRKGSAEGTGLECEMAVRYVVQPFSTLPISIHDSPSTRQGVSHQPHADEASMRRSRRRQILQNDDGSLDYVLRHLLQSNPQERLLLEDARLLKFFCLYGSQRHELVAIKNEGRQRWAPLHCMA